MTEELGWWVVRIDARSPCSLTVASPRSYVEITITDRRLGLGLRDQLQRLGPPR
jgi:hypothetical protein